MRLKLTLLFFLVFLLVIGSCKETETPTPPPVNQTPDPDNPGSGVTNPVTNLPTVVVNIVVPEGLDLTGGIVSTGLMDFPIEANGQSKVVLPPEVTRIAYVFDKDDRLVMMGNISQISRVISVETTADALAYLGLGMWYFPEEVHVKFFESLSEIKEITQFKNEVISLSESDPYFLEKGQFESSLGRLTSALEQERVLVDIRSRQIDVDRTGKVSGLQIYENDPQTIKIQNYYRRLAKAFIYKHAFIQKGDEENKLQIIKDNFSGSDKADNEVSVTGTTAFGGTIGTIADWALGKGMDYAMVETEPIQITLGQNEKETRYKVRLIGPSFRGTSNFTLTDTEREAFRDLMIRQFAFDFVLPIMGEVFSELSDKFEADYFRDEVIIEVVKYLYSKYPNLWDMLVNGDWKNAGIETMKYMIVEMGGGYLQDQLVKKIVDRYATLPNQNYIELNREFVNQRKVDRYLKTLKIIDLTIKTLDMVKLTGEISVSNTLEEFVVKAIEHDIKLSPKEASVLAFKDTPFTVSSQSGFSDGQALLFKWRTSGTYGFLKDDLGNQGVELENGQKTVNYRSNKTAAQIPDDAVDTIYVEAYLKQGNNLERIGNTKAVVTVKPAELVVKPDGISLQGTTKDQVKLYVEWANNDVFHQPDVFDYKYEWSTTGNFGLLDGKLKEANTLNPYFTYQALDEEIEEGIDQITVRVSLSPKGKNEYSYYATAKGEVKVINDENYEIKHYPLIVRTVTNSSGIYTGYDNFLSAVFDKKENHEEYTIRFFGFKKRIIPSMEGRTYKWKADQNPPSSINITEKLKLTNQFGVSALGNGAACVIPNPCPSGPAAGQLQAWGGMLEVKIKLKR